MKVFIVLAAIVFCAYAAPLKSELLQRAEALDMRIKNELKRLQAEKKEHIGHLLQEEEKRLEEVAKELKETAETDLVKTAVLEDRLITLEFRVENEINVLQREAAEQELLLNNAKILKQWLTEEIATLEKDPEHVRRNHMIIEALKREERRLEEIAEELSRAQELRRIEFLEVELRAIEVRIYEALMRLHFEPATGTTAPHTNPTTEQGSTTTAKPVTHPSTAQPTTGKPTAQPTTAPTVHPSVPTTAKH